MDTDQEKFFFDNILESVIAIDKDKKVREVNNATLKLLGYKRKEDISMWPINKICKNFSIDRRVKIPIQEKELIYLKKDGKEILVSVNITPRFQYPEDIILIARDISKIKELINELTQSREELKSSCAELRGSKDELVRSERLAFTGRIAASIAHEIRNPLTNVAMSVQQLKKTFKAKNPLHKHVEIVTRNIKKIDYLIAELLNCARPPKLNFYLYDIHRILKEVLESTKAKLKLQKIKVVKKFTSKPSLINMDKEHIGRVFLNMLNNAIEAMPKRGGKLTVATELNKNFFVVKIQDTGRGISEKNIIKIFDPFFSTKPNGVGLGLTVCYGIIVSHGGTIEVESKPRKGSNFTVSLPIKQR